MTTYTEVGVVIWWRISKETNTSTREYFCYTLWTCTYADRTSRSVPFRNKIYRVIIRRYDCWIKSDQYKDNHRITWYSAVFFTLYILPMEAEEAGPSSRKKNTLDDAVGKLLQGGYIILYYILYTRCPRTECTKLRGSWLYFHFRTGITIIQTLIANTNIYMGTEKRLLNFYCR